LHAEHVDIRAGGEEAGRPCSNLGIPLADPVWNVIQFVIVTRTMVLFNRQLYRNNGAVKSVYGVYRF
jgi:hypothetical protein